ncbi:hypothetical protein Hanom_Chr12g01075871 [Helianthus anomalus]
MQFLIYFKVWFEYLQISLILNRAFSSWASLKTANISGMSKIAPVLANFEGISAGIDVLGGGINTLVLYSKLIHRSKSASAALWYNFAPALLRLSRALLITVELPFHSSMMFFILTISIG